MIFAIWAANRATQDTDRTDIPSVPSVSRPSNVVMSSANADTVVNDDKGTIHSKPGKLEANEALGGEQYEDVRPAVFSSRFWEICCIASLVCGQLTNVRTGREGSNC